MKKSHIGIFRQRKTKKIDLEKRDRREKAILRVIILVLEFVTICLILYMVLYPMYPNVKYKMAYQEPVEQTEEQAIATIKQQVAEIKNKLPENKDKQKEERVIVNRVIIPKIGVNSPIVESQSAEVGLSKGAWRVPHTSTPDKGGNTVITGHRFKYLPPNNLTFYLFHELEVGDLVSVIWSQKDLLYRIREIKIVDKTEISIQDPTIEPILTMFTCHPIYSTEQRLVVVADLIEKEE